MINLEEVARFVRAEAGEGLLLDSDKRRVVRLELNTAEPCQLKVQLDQKDIRFLANVHGRETVTFIADGPVMLWPDSDGEVWWFTPEMETSSVVVPDPQVFTKVAVRPARNPEMERVMAKMQENSNRMFAQLAGVVDDLARQNNALKQEVDRAKPKKPAKPKATDNGGAGGAGGGDAGATGQEPPAEGNGGGGDDDGDT